MNKNKVVNAVYSAVVGDALGVPYEFKSREEMQKNPATKMTGYGTYNQPEGSWSDDSSMMLCILEWLTEMKIKYPSDTFKSIQSADYMLLKDKWLNWYVSGYMTPHGKCFDIGIQTRSALMEVGLSNHISENQFSQGNGALMRILPFGFFDYSDEVVDVMKRTNAITHGSTVSQNACMDMLRLYDYAKKMSTNELLDTFTAYVDFSSDIVGSGWVVKSFQAVLWSIIHPNTNVDDPQEFYKNVILNAVNLGDDTDTTAIIAGGLVGIHFDNNVPTEWKSLIKNQEKIDEVINNFCEAYGIQ